MKLTAKQYAVAFHQAIFETKPTDHDKVLDNFIEVLKENNDLGLMDEIEQAFFAYERSQKGITQVEVTSARELSRADEQQILEGLNQQVRGRVELKKQMDEGLVGGVVIKIDDQLIDGSVKKQLQELKKKLIE